MFVLLLKLDFDVWLNPATMNMLCRSMLIIPDVENRTCPDLDDLKAQFPMRMNDRSVICLMLRGGRALAWLFEIITS